MKGYIAEFIHQPNGFYKYIYLYIFIQRIDICDGPCEKGHFRVCNGYCIFAIYHLKGFP